MNEVLTLDNAAKSAAGRARLHAANCTALRMFNGKRGRMIVQVADAEELAEIIADLEANGWPVKRCKCLRK